MPAPPPYSPRLHDSRLERPAPPVAWREVILWFCLGGEIFGLAEVARGGERAVNAQACTDSELLAVPNARFRAFLAEHPCAALLTMQVLSSWMRVLGEIFVNLVSDDVNTRIAKLIVRLAAHHGTQRARTSC